MPKKKQPQTEFGERLVVLRQRRGFTQVQLAQVAGVTQRAISYYETMPGYPAAPAVIALASALRVSTDELLGVRSLSKSPSDQQARGERKLWRKLRQVAQLPERDQRAVLRIISSVAAGALRRAG